jgi:SAM-dependent methyltransferase
MTGPGGRPGAATAWWEGEQFAAQCGRPGPRAVVEHRWHVFAEAIDRWREAHPINSPLRVFDAGCGDGINLLGLSNILRVRRITFELVGLDYNMLRLARARALQLADVVQGSLTSAPIADAAFDLVLCNHVIEHIVQPVLAAREVARVLKPGGLAIIGVPNEGCALAHLRNHVLQRSILRTTDHVNFFTSATLASALCEAGLSLRATHTEGFFLPHLRLNGWAALTPVGRVGLEFARRILPSHAAGLIAIATRNS